jgi:hypothetical protein
MMLVICIIKEGLNPSNSGELVSSVTPHCLVMQNELICSNCLKGVYVFNDAYLFMFVMFFSHHMQAVFTTCIFDRRFFFFSFYEQNFTTQGITLKQVSMVVISAIEGK